MLGVAGVQVETVNATKLLDWIRRKKLKTVTMRDVMRLGPYAIRDSRAAKNALKLLNENFWITTEDGTTYTVSSSMFCEDGD